MYPNFNNKILKIAASQSRDNMLFGEDFGEKLNEGYYLLQLKKTQGLRLQKPVETREEKGEDQLEWQQDIGLQENIHQKQPPESEVQRRPVQLQEARGNQTSLEI
nr:unnamed protein product [Callosobruchus analis]